MDAAEKIVKRIEAESTRRFLPLINRIKGGLLERLVRAQAGEGTGNRDTDWLFCNNDSQAVARYGSNPA